MKKAEEKKKKAEKKQKPPRKRHPVATSVALTAAFAASIGVCHMSFNKVAIEPEDLMVEDSADGIYSGEELAIESSSNNVDFLGMAGDKNYVDIAMKLTNKDGSPFVDDIKDTWISLSSENDLIGWRYGYVYTDIQFTCPKWLKTRYGNSNNDTFGNIEDRDDVYSYIDLSFEDESTIVLSVFANSMLGGLKGETMTMTADDLSAFTVEKILCDHSEYQDNEDYEENGLNKLIEEYEKEETDGYVVMIHPDTWDIVLCRETPLTLDLDLSVKLTYKTDQLKLNAVNVEACADDWSSGSEGDFAVTPFGMKFNYSLVIKETEDEPKFNMWGGNVEKIMDMLTQDYESEITPPPEEMMVELKDGSRITAKTDYNYFNVDDSSEQYRFYRETETGTLYPTTILPDDIVKIESNGVVLYSK